MLRVNMISPAAYRTAANLLASILVLPRYGVDMLQLVAPIHVLLVAFQAMKHCGYALPRISEDVQETCLQRLTATMRFIEGVPPDLVEQMITKSFVDHPERYLLVLVYGHLRQHDLLRVFVQTCLREWAYGRTWSSSAERTDWLPAFLAYYNARKPHSTLGYKPPASRLGGITYCNSTLGVPRHAVQAGRSPFRACVSIFG